MIELLGPNCYGRVRGYGVGVTPTQLSNIRRYTQDARESSSNIDISMLKARMEAQIKEQVEAPMQEQVEAWVRVQVQVGVIKQNYDTVISSLKIQIDQLTSSLHTFVDSSKVHILLYLLRTRVRPVT